MTIRKRKPLTHTQIADACRARIAEMRHDTDIIANDPHPQVREAWLRCTTEIDTLQRVIYLIEHRLTRII